MSIMTRKRSFSTAARAILAVAAVSTLGGCAMKSDIRDLQTEIRALTAAASDERPAKVINIASIDGIRLNPLDPRVFLTQSAMGFAHFIAREATPNVAVINAIAHVIITEGLTDEALEAAGLSE